MGQWRKQQKAEWEAPREQSIAEPCCLKVKVQLSQTLANFRKVININKLRLFNWLQPTPCREPRAEKNKQKLKYSSLSVETIINKHLWRPRYSQKARNVKDLVPVTCFNEVNPLKETEEMNKRFHLCRLTLGRSLMLLRFWVEWKLPPRKNKGIIKALQFLWRYCQLSSLEERNAFLWHWVHRSD